MVNYSPIIEALNKKQLVVILGLPIEHHQQNDLSLTQQEIAYKLCAELGVTDVSYEDAVDIFIRRKGKQELIMRFNSYLIASPAYPLYFELLNRLQPKCVIETHPFSQWYTYVKNQPGASDYCSQKNFSEDFDVINTAQVFLSYFGSCACGNPLLASNEMNDRFNERNNLSVTFQSLLRNQLVFIGFNPNDRFFKRVYDHFCRRNGEYPNSAYLLTDDISLQEPNAYGSSENLIVCQNIADTLNHIISEYDEKKSKKDGPIGEQPVKRNRSPYKYLNSFEEEDSDIFFGREKELVDLCTRVEATSQILVVSSKSGYGKTSMINAGLIPKLRERGEYDVYYIRCGNNPWEELNRSVFKKNIKASETLAATDFSSKKYQFIIIDQFEELFTGGSETEIATFREGINNFLHDNPNTKLILSIREDFYHMIGKSNIIQYLDKNDYFLLPLPQNSAIEAIIKPAEQFGISFEDGLPQEIVDDLDSGEHSDNGDNGIDPSQLQIVCDKLYRESVIMQEKIISFTLYNKLGRAEGILANYIEDSLGIFNDDPESLSQAKEILKSMISISGNTRKFINSQDLTNIPNGTEIMKSLISTRLVRTIRDGFELTHDCIITKIRNWMDIDSLNIRKLDEMLNNDLLRWQQYPTTQNYISNNEMINDINTYRTRIIHNEDMDAFILASLVSSNIFMSGRIQDEDAIFWIEQCKGNLKLNQYFDCIICDRKGYIRNNAILILSVLLNNIEILDDNSANINPHIYSVIQYLRSLNISISDDFNKKINIIIEGNRTKNMVDISSGTVTLGLSSKDAARLMHDQAKQLKQFFPNNERTVLINQFKIDKYLVTNAEYAEFDENHIYSEDKANFPVVCLSYGKAKKYAEWWKKTIPNEDQWEYAARGSDGRYFPWGSEWNPDDERRLEESEKKCNTSLTGTDGLAEVDAYPNGISDSGCYNMAGMVWEWTSTAPQGRFSPERKIVKGGSWSLMGILPWAWYRFHVDGLKDFYNVGFRCVISE